MGPSNCSLSPGRISIAILWLLPYLGLVVGSATLHRRQNVTETDIWGSIVPSKHLTWTPCYTEPLQCARFEVPLDYSNPNGRQAAIALIRRPASMQEGYQGPVFLNPGGPGGSGVSFVITLGEALSTFLGPQFDIVSFDPRGIARSTPRASYFDTDVERALWVATSGDIPVVRDGVVSGVQRPWARGRLLGSLAEKHDDGYLQHLTTENTATDMLSIARAHGKEKIQYWGFSYGSILGATFAAMYPDKVQRLVIDGVMEADDYYSTGWYTNILDADKTLQLFFDTCVESGPTICPFYSPDPADIRRNLTALYDRIDKAPLAFNGGDYYGIVDRTALRSAVITALYSPYSSFGPLSRGLSLLAAGNATGMVDLLVPPPSPFVCPTDPHEHDFDQIGPEGRASFVCNDGDEIPGSLEAMQEHWNRVTEVSEFGDIWGHISSDCVNWPKNKKPFRGPFVGNTSHPILLIGNTADPVTPLRSAHKMAEGFEGARVLTLDAGGHASLAAASVCIIQHVREYFVNGTLPPANTICQPVSKNPFVPPTAALAREGIAGRGLSGDEREDAKLLSAVVEASERSAKFLRPL